jgi:hypothetical protein
MQGFRRENGRARPRRFAPGIPIPHWLRWMKGHQKPGLPGVVFHPSVIMPFRALTVSRGLPIGSPRSSIQTVPPLCGFCDLCNTDIAMEAGSGVVATGHVWFTR